MAQTKQGLDHVIRGVHVGWLQVSQVKACPPLFLPVSLETPPGKQRHLQRIHFQHPGNIRVARVQGRQTAVDEPLGLLRIAAILELQVEMQIGLSWLVIKI